MSVAEKLGALGPDLDAVLDELIAWIDTDNVGCIEVEQRGEQMRLRLRNAFPQIVAVVEAAERLLPFLQEYSEDAGEQGFQTAASDMHLVHTSTAAALAALDEKLNGAEVPPEPERTQ